MSTVHLEKFFIVCLAEHILNLFLINFIDLLVQIHILVELLGNQNYFSLISSYRLLHGFFKIENEWFELFVIGFHNLEFISNFIPEACPILIL